MTKEEMEAIKACIFQPGRKKSDIAKDVDKLISAIEELRGELVDKDCTITMLRDSRDRWESKSVETIDENINLQSEVERLKDVLMFYADEKNYSTLTQYSEVMYDEGQKAREALNENNS